jgi:hypothetical protein
MNGRFRAGERSFFHWFGAPAAYHEFLEIHYLCFKKNS